MRPLLSHRVSYLAVSCLALVPALACSASANGGAPAAGGSTTGSAGSVATGGSASGAAGSAQSGAAMGGSSTAGASGSSGAAGGGEAGASVAGNNSGGGGGAAAALPCPADATFCSGFEDATLPATAVYKVNAAPGDWSRDFAIDSAIFRGGQSALRVKSGAEPGTSGSAYQMLAVPAPEGAFWVRFYIRQDELDIGGVDHNVFAGAADSDEPNSSVMVELAEDVGLAFNTNDDVRWPMGFGRVNGQAMPFTLPKGMWHCIEISYDSAQRVQQVYVAGKLQIDATNYPASVGAPFKIFKFGFNKLHGPARSVWFDDVAVGPTRASCL